MKTVIAPDSFKECLSAREVAGQIAKGVGDVARAAAHVTRLFLLGRMKR